MPKRPKAPTKARAPKVAATGARPATKADFAQAGLPYKPRYFVRGGQFLTRRQAEKPVIGTPEKYARANYYERGGLPSGSAKFYRYLRAFNEARENEGLDRVTRSDPEFRALYRAATTTGRNPEAARRRLEALTEIFPDDGAVFANYTEAYVGTNK